MAASNVTICTSGSNQLHVANFGGLGSNHLLGAMSIVGLFPYWMYDECTLDPTSKGFKHVVEEYSVPSGQAGADALFKTLCVAFRRRYGISSSRFVENVVCKAYQWAVVVVVF
jgi:hypothetical protein